MKILVTLAREHPGSSAALVALLLVGTVAEGIGLSALLPLLSLASGAGGEASSPGNRIERWFAEAFEAMGVEMALEPVLVAISITFLFRGAIALYARAQIGYIVARRQTELRMRFLSAVLKTRWSYYVDKPIGRFANTYNIEVMRAGRLYLEGAMLVQFALTIVIYLVLALATSWVLTLAIFVLGLMLVFGLRPLVVVGRRSGKKQTDLMRRISEQLTDLLQGVKALRAMALEERVSPMIARDTRKVEKARRREILSQEALSAIQEPLLVPFLGAGLWFAVSILEIELSAVIVVGLVCIRTLNQVGKAQKRYHKMMVDVSAYESLIDATVEAEEAEEPYREGEAPTLDQGVELADVSMRRGEQSVLRNLSLTIPSGQVVALAGPSGSGKTTIVDLVAGLLAPDEGEVRIDGRPLSEIEVRKWRQRIGYVAQDAVLLHDSVLTNVSLGDPDISREDVERALREAHVLEVVERMSDGIDTWVGERGSALSGGQRQRIAIARALVRRPWLLILDEATTGLDPESERMVLDAIREIREHTTVLAISHQPQLLEIADLVFRVEDGVATPLEAGAAAARAV